MLEKQKPCNEEHVSVVTLYSNMYVYFKWPE